ncbi:glycoside hydrolase family 2 protein [Mucisphaera calidilacus]|uniref:beta-galactosidase n=1 Tax=Mucisphaera calidilacus TaxID=2527982 RepID=A0A518BX26_9BACT|nr:glycoside hydrolase family 2 TIM barrel-domain containing protein [Mucisphaera calidilacus]QDU71533.1 Beta-galactosidase [Mucisphaera calidilacus]
MYTTDRNILHRLMILIAAVAACSLLVSPTRAQNIEGDPAKARQQELAQQEAGLGLAAGGTAAEILPKVRLTPRDVSITGLDEHRITLDGTWRFVHEVPESFDGSAGSVKDWGEVQIPRHYALQGYPRMHRKFGVPVAYAKRFTIPDTWRGRRVALRFEGVDGYAKLWVNGQPAGKNDIATLPSEYDITPFIRAGENELTLTVEKSLVTHWSRRELGGITRTVYLQAMTEVNLARLHVDTRLNADAASATMNVHLRVANQSDAVTSNLFVQLALERADGTPVAIDSAEARTPLPAIAPGQTLEFMIPVRVHNIETWTAESPSLYIVTGELIDEERSLMSARQRFGFRDVRVAGHQLLINGSPVKLRGTNYHITHPDHGESVPRDLIQHDIELFKGCNFNALRSRPTPVYDYVELCDEMGVYTTVEAMVSIMMYDKGPAGDYGADPAIAGPYRHHVATMIESYYSNPSVITWGLGNECAYYDYFKVAALGMHKRDPSRPLFFGSDNRLGVGIPYMDINDDHYPRNRGNRASVSIDDLSHVADDAWDYPDDRPVFFTEWLHVHTNNVKEIAYDPGVDEFWARYAEIHLNHMYRMPHFLGGFHFKGAPYRNIGAPGIWRGVFDADRRINNLYWHVLKSHSPVRIHETAGLWDPVTQTLNFAVENRYDFTSLDELTLNWTHGDQTGQAVAVGDPGQTGKLMIPMTDPADPRPISLEVRDPHGALIDRYHLTVRGTQQQRQTPAAGKNHPLEIEQTDDLLIVTTGDVRYTLDRTTGLITQAARGGDVVIDGSPSLLALPAQLKNFRGQQKRTLVNQAVGWQAQHVDVSQREDHVRILATGRYTQAEGTITTTLHADGTAELAYDFTWTGTQPFALFSSGLTFPVTASHDRIRWDRKALWSVYPDDHIGRSSGIAIAAGNPALAASRTSYTEGPRPWPWSADLVSGVTRDFRSTKFDIRTAGLIDQQNKGLLVVGNGRQHVQAVPRNDDLEGNIFTAELHGPPADGFDLHVLDFHNGGTEPHLLKSIHFELRDIEFGSRLTGGATLRLGTYSEDAGR